MIRNLMASAVIGLCAAGAASASTVQNGSFEDGVSGTSSWDLYPAGIPGWSTTAGGIEVQKNLLIGAFDGDYYVELDGTSNYTISQTVSLAAGSYYLSFAYSPREDNVDSNGVAYAVGSLLSGSIAGPGGSSASSVGSWTTVTNWFHVATAGNYALSFTGFGGPGDHVSYGGFVDAVDISAVPVPAGGLLLISALGGIAGLRRRKSA